MTIRTQYQHSSYLISHSQTLKELFIFVPNEYTRPQGSRQDHLQRTSSRVLRNIQRNPLGTTLQPINHHQSALLKQWNKVVQRFHVERRVQHLAGGLPEIVCNSGIRTLLHVTHTTNQISQTLRGEDAQLQLQKSVEHGSIAAVRVTQHLRDQIRMQHHDERARASPCQL